MTHEELIAYAVELLAKSAKNSLLIEENRPALSYNHANGAIATEQCDYEFFTITGRIDFEKKEEGENNG